MRILSIDYQKDFCAEGGKWYLYRPSHHFINATLVPFLERTGVTLAEIVSDYRLPRPNEHEEYCIPGTFGFESAIPANVKSPNVWIKCMNSPIWVRKTLGARS